jgi:glutamate-1-semialdehyde 2,1-aminomutase
MTGFRVHRGGAQALYGVTPDLTTLGKVIGGGLPVGAYGGRREIMELVAPCGDVYQAGTLSGNPLAMAAGLATLTELRNDQLWAAMQARVETLAESIFQIASEKGVPIYQTRVGTMFSTFFTEAPVQDWSSAQPCDLARFSTFFHSMLSQGIYIAPSQFEAGFMSTVHDERTMSRSLDAARIAIGS